MAKEKTRQKILNAAERLFSRDGYDGVPTKLIAKEAGITEMTLFNHFPKKQLLYKTVVKERYLAIEIDSVISNLKLENLEEDLLTIADSLIRNFMGNRKILMMRLKEKESFTEDDTFNMDKDPLLSQIIPVLISYEVKGLLNMEGEKAARVFMAAFKGICHLCLLENKREEDIKELISAYVKTFCHGVCAQ